MPALLKVHRSVGPPSGQNFKRPVSFETLVRSGPCHWGQSAAGEVKAIVKAKKGAPRTDFIFHLAGGREKLIKGAILRARHVNNFNESTGNFPWVSFGGFCGRGGNIGHFRLAAAEES